MRNWNKLPVETRNELEPILAYIIGTTYAYDEEKIRTFAARAGHLSWQCPQAKTLMLAIVEWTLDLLGLTPKQITWDRYPVANDGGPVADAHDGEYIPIADDAEWDYDLDLPQIKAEWNRDLYSTTQLADHIADANE